MRDDVSLSRRLSLTWRIRRVISVLVQALQPSSFLCTWKYLHIRCFFLLLWFMGFWYWMWFIYTYWSGSSIRCPCKINRYLNYVDSLSIWCMIYMMYNYIMYDIRAGINNFIPWFLLEYTYSSMPWHHNHMLWYPPFLHKVYEYNFDANCVRFVWPPVVPLSLISFSRVVHMYLETGCSRRNNNSISVHANCLQRDLICREQDVSSFGAAYRFIWVIWRKTPAIFGFDRFSFNFWNWNVSLLSILSSTLIKYTAFHFKGIFIFNVFS